MRLRTPSSRLRLPAVPVVRGFTLMELLVTLSLIVILTALLLPVLAQARGAARATTCAQHLRQIGAAMAQYTDDCDGGYPIPYGEGRRGAWGARLQPYLKSWTVLRCPAMTAPRLGSISLWEFPGLPPEGNQDVFCGFGFNADYLAAALTPDAFDQEFPRTGPPVRTFQVSRSAETVLCVGISLAPGPGSWAGRSPLWPVGGGFCLAPAPATVGSRDVVTYPYGGWGPNSYLGP
ncbi:MAG TPA: type II secretion system protein, partial [Armatimonadota bacterium]|nr:type II secretion system protein [Armatimonadota bacterium]